MEKPSLRYILQGIAWSYVVMVPGALLILIFGSSWNPERTGHPYSFNPKDIPDSVINFSIVSAVVGLGIRRYPHLVGKLLPDHPALEALGKEILKSSPSVIREKAIEPWMESLYKEDEEKEEKMNDEVNNEDNNQSHVEDEVG